jgi:hypothetical protein
LWLHHNVEEATWELESEIRSKYPHLFDMLWFSRFEVYVLTLVLMLNM